MSEDRPRRVLVLGDLSAHITEQIKEALQDNQTELVMIPDISDDEARRIFARTGEVVLTTSTPVSEEHSNIFRIDPTLTAGGGFGFIDHAEPCQPPASDMSDEDERRHTKWQQQQDRKRFEQQQRARHKMSGRKR
ncbi:hypothetical protein [Ralstonia phage phiRSL1]|uniref:Uncharacterized protein n=1 Tax=Ralstonia phage phiRSL1 TaxID=1980924 RepID=B2ZYE4_9CAUD|nr:hypothetical protein RSL1_ORF241 [Ralstonia phage phiRSL1]BAG41690.1 hypothetical protein [Ralstonia phage phiRSL1]